MIASLQELFNNLTASVDLIARKYEVEDDEPEEPTIQDLTTAVLEL